MLGKRVRRQRVVHNDHRLLIPYASTVVEIHGPDRANSCISRVQERVRGNRGLIAIQNDWSVAVPGVSRLEGLPINPNLKWADGKGYLGGKGSLAYAPELREPAAQHSAVDRDYIAIVGADNAGLEIACNIFNIGAQ